MCEQIPGRRGDETQQPLCKLSCSSSATPIIRAGTGSGARGRAGDSCRQEAGPSIPPQTMTHLCLNLSTWSSHGAAGEDKELQGQIRKTCAGKRWPWAQGLGNGKPHSGGDCSMAPPLPFTFAPHSSFLYCSRKGYIERLSKM